MTSFQEKEKKKKKEKKKRKRKGYYSPTQIIKYLGSLVIF